MYICMCMQYCYLSSLGQFSYSQSQLSCLVGLHVNEETSSVLSQKGPQWQWV